MSIRVMTAVWENGPSSQGELLVMLALADWSNDSGESWPSMEGIAKKARLSDARSARRIVRRLEEAGWIEIDTGGGRHGCNRYTIKPGPLVPRTESPPDPERKKPGPSLQKTRTLEPAEPSIEPSVEPSKNTRARGGYPDDFEVWWECYPKKTGKDVAFRSFQKAKAKVGKALLFEALQDQLPQLQDAANRPDGNFCPNPATWLNQGRYHDEPSRPQPNLMTQIANGDFDAWNSSVSENVLPLLPARSQRD